MTEREIFIAALQIEDPKERQSYVDRVCDGSLKQRIQELLAENDRLDGYLEEPAVLDDEVHRVADQPGTMIGRYKLLQEIGEGGFGTVFMAEQTVPVRRRIALKIIKPGMDTKEVIARFEAERQALAIMDHPNITRVLDAGETESGRPFFAMELVKGIPITDYCDRHHLSLSQRLALFVGICHAVQHAHQKGVIHRDLKPSNVMISMYNGSPVPKIIDFGIAKALNQPLTEKTVFTRYGQFVGTPQYMSPEQAEMSGQDVDTRSDVYSLGILLYELLTGRPAFDDDTLRAAGFDEMRRIICEEEPARPSNLVRTLDHKVATTVASQRSTQPQELGDLLRGDLDWIVMKAIDKDRDRRYTTAENLALDINRCLASEPILARPPTAGYRLRKLFSRHRRAFLSIIASAGVLLLAFGICAVGFFQARTQRDRAVAAEHAAVQAKTQAEKNEGIAEQREQEARAEARKSTATLRLLLNFISRASLNFAGNDVTAEELVSSLARDVEHLAAAEGETAAPIYLALGRLAVSRDDLDVAISHLEKCAEILGSDDTSAESVACLRYLGYAQRSVEQLKHVADLERSGPGGKPHFKTLALLGNLYLSEDILSDAERVLRQACQQFENDPTLLIQENPWFYFARVLERQGKSLEANTARVRSVEVCRELFKAELASWNHAGWELRYAVNRRYGALLLQISEDIAQVEKAPIPHNACRLYRDMGEPDKAMESAIVLFDDTKRDWEHTWLYVIAGRICYDVCDFENSANYLNNAITVFERQRSPRFTVSAIWCRHELAGVYRALGNDDEAREQETIVAKALESEIEKPIFWMTSSLTKSVFIMSSLHSADEPDLAALLAMAKIATQTPNEVEKMYANAALGMVLERLQQPRNAIDAYVAAANGRYYHEHLYMGWLEDRLVSLLKETNQLEQADLELEKLVTKRDRELQRRDPECALGRVRLARFLIETKRSPQRAKEVLQEADAILTHHKTAPVSVKLDVQQLFERVSKS